MEDLQREWMRAEFAARVMAALIAARCPDALISHEKAAKDAVGYADALLKALYPRRRAAPKEDG